MANYKNSLGESELFGRMTAGFAKVCESVQSGKFVRDEMGVICESVCEDEETYPDHIDITPEEYADLEGEIKDYAIVCRGGNPAWRNEAEWFNLVYGFILWWIAKKVRGSDRTTSLAAPKCEHTRINILDSNGKRVCAFEPIELAKKEVGLDYVESLVSPPDEIRLEDVNDDGATADAGTEGATQDADVASATPEQINGSVTECGNVEKKPLKKLIPEGCCGGKAKKVLKEEVQKLCKTCGNPLDETGTCQDCQGYSEVKEGEGEIKLQVPASVQRRANLKVNAKANQEKVAQAIRDGKADGIVSEDEEEKIPDGVQLLMGILDKAFKLERGGSCPGEVPVNRVENGLEKKKPFSSGVLVKLNKDGKRSCCGVDDEGEYHLDELIVDEIIDEAGKRGLKVEFSPHHLDGFDGTFRIVDDSAFKNRTVEEGENTYVVKKGGIGYYVKDAANDKAVSPSFDTKEEAEQYLKNKFPAKEKGSVELTKDDVFGMLVNLLEQIRDGVSVDDVTANPDMDAFDDYSLDEVLELAGQYL